MVQEQELEPLAYLDVPERIHRASKHLHTKEVSVRAYSFLSGDPILLQWRLRRNHSRGSKENDWDACWKLQSVYDEALQPASESFEEADQQAFFWQSIRENHSEFGVQGAKHQE